MVGVLWKGDGGKIEGIDDRFLEEPQGWRQRPEDRQVMAKEIMTQQVVGFTGMRVQFQKRLLYVEPLGASEQPFANDAADRIHFSAFVGFNVQKKACAKEDVRFHIDSYDTEIRIKMLTIRHVVQHTIAYLSI